MRDMEGPHFAVRPGFPGGQPGEGVSKPGNHFPVSLLVSDRHVTVLVLTTVRSEQAGSLISRFWVGEKPQRPPDKRLWLSSFSLSTSGI